MPWFHVIVLTLVVWWIVGIIYIYWLTVRLDDDIIFDILFEWLNLMVVQGMSVKIARWVCLVMVTIAWPFVAGARSKRR